MAAAGSASWTPSPLVKYIGLTALLVATVVLSYLSKVFPDWFATVGIVAYVPAVAYYAAHDLEESGPLNGVPVWTTFAVITIVSAVEGALGQFVLSNGTITLAAGLVWVIGILNYIFHALSEDAGVNAPPQAENWVIAAIGVAIGLLTAYYSDPTASVTAFLVTGYTVVGQYIHVSTDGSSVSVQPVTPAPSPGPTPSAPPTP